jgi:hypothetical protein
MTISIGRVDLVHRQGLLPSINQPCSAASPSSSMMRTAPVYGAHILQANLIFGLMMA